MSDKQLREDALYALELLEAEGCTQSLYKSAKSVVEAWLSEHPAQVGSVSDIRMIDCLVTGANWLVWSNEHRAWWGPNHAHYYWSIEAAGRYTLEEAQKICTIRGVERGDGINPPELIQPSPEWLALRARIKAELEAA